VLDLGAAIGEEAHGDHIEADAIDRGVVRESLTPEQLACAAEASSLLRVDAREGASPRSRPARAHLDEDDHRALAQYEIDLEAPDAHVRREQFETAGREPRSGGALGAITERFSCG